MAGETLLTVVGNLTAAPELRFTSSGAGVASFTVASTPRTFNKQTNSWEDGDALFMRCTAWRRMAENIAESLNKGDRVVVTGRLQQRSYDTREGEKRTVIELQADEVAPSLKYATAKVSRVSRDSGDGGFGQSQHQAPANDDPWATPARMPDARYSPPGGFSDEPPFLMSPRMWDLNV